MRNEMKCLSVCHTWIPIWGMKWNVCPSVIRGFQYEEWNEMSVRLSYVVSNMRNEMKCLSVCHTWFPIWGMKWNVCPSQSYVVSNMRNEMKCCLSVCHTWFPIWGMKWNVCPSVIRGFQYEEWNEMSVRLSHTWFPIWGMKWNVCPSVIRGFQYEEWNEMSVRLSHTWFPIWGMKWNVCPSVIRGFQYEEWNEMSVRLSHTWFPIWEMKWNVVCPSVIRGFQYEEWNEMSVRLSYVVSNMRNEMKCLSVSVIRGFQYEEWNEMSVRLSYVVSNMRNEMKCCLSVCHTWFPIWGMKWNVCPSVIRGFQYEEWNEMSVRLSYVVSNMRNEMKCLSVCHTWFPIWGMKWNVCPSVIRGFQYEEWNEMSVRLSYVVSNMRNEMKCLSVCHTWFPIWGMKWNVCPSVIRGFQYEEWNEMLSVRLSYVVSNMRNEMKCLSVCHTMKCLSFCHTWFPIWGMKWNVVCPSVIRGFQYEEWNEMSVRLSYVVSNMRNEMKCLSVSVIRGFQYEEWNEMSVRLSYVVSNMRNEMKCCLSVCHTWFPIWGMKWNVVCPSVIRGFQYEEWNEMLSVRLSYVVSNMRNEMKCLSVCHTWFPIWGMKWNVCPSQSYVVSNMRNEMKCLSVCHTWFPIWGMKWNVCPSQSYVVSNMRNEMLSVRLSYVVSNMRNEMKCLSVSVIRGFQYEEWNEMSVRLSHTWFPIWGMKWNVCPSVIRGFQYEEWNEMSVRQSYVVSNMRNEMKCCLSVCHTWFPIWGMKWNVCPSVIRGFQYEEWNEMSVRLSYVVSNMRNEMKCLSVCHTWFPIWGMKWNVCPSVIRGFQYEEWNEMLSVRLSHTWFPIWGMKWNVCPSVIRGFQYEEWNEMLSFLLSYVVSNMRNEMKCLSVCHTWFPIWGMKWNVCPSVIRGFQYEEWNEMSVRLSYVVSNMRNEMKCLSVCHTWFPIWGMKWNVVCPSVIRGFQYEEWNEMLSVRLSYVVSNMRNEMKCLSVCHTWFPIWGMKWNVCPSVIRGFQYEEWNEMSVRHTWFPIWGMKWNVVCPSVIRGFQYEEWNENVCPSVIRGFQYEEWNEMLSVRLSYVVSNMRNEMKCLSVCHTWFPIWGMKWNVCPSVIRGFQYEEWNEMSVRLSYVVSNMRNEMKCCLSVCHTWFPIWGMKWNVCPSVIRGFQYEEWNEMSVRLSYVVSNMRNEMKCCLSVCHTWFPIWEMKWNVCPSVIRGFQYEEWNEMSVRLSHTWFPIWGMKWNVCPSVIRGFQYEEWNEMSVRLSYVVSNMRNEMKCLSVCHTWFPIWGMKWNVVCPSVIRGFQYEEWNEMSVRLSYVVSNMRNEMKCCLSVCHTWFPIWGMKWNVCPSVIRGFQYEEWNEMLSVVVIRGFQYEEWNEMSVRHTWFPIWGMKWNVVCPSVIRGFQYEEWNEMSVRLSHTWFPIWGMKWNVVCPSVIRGFQYEEWNEMSVRLSYVVSNMRNEMKCLSVSVIRGFQYEEWNEMSVRLSYVVSNMRNEMKCCLSVSVIRGFQYEEWNEMSVRLSYVVSNMRNEMKCLSVCHTWFPIWGMKWNVCPSVIRGFQYEEWNEMSVRLSHTWFPIWGMKWNVCPSVIRGFQYEEWNEMSVRLSYVVSNMRNEMSVRLSYVVSNMRNEMKCLSVSVIRGFQYEEWNEMSVRLSYVVSNMRNEMKCCLSVSVIRGFQYEEWNEMSVRLSYVVSNMRNEMKCLSVCHTWFPIWGMKWNVCPSVIRGFQYEEWNEMSVRLSYVVSNMRNEMKCCLSSLSYVVSNMRNEMKCLSVSVIRGFQYEEWNEMLSVSRLSYVVSNMRNEMKCLSVCHTWFPIWGMKWNVCPSSHTWFPIWGMKWNVCPSVIRGFQYEEWNEMSVRLSYVVSNMRNEMKCCLSVCHTWFPIWGMKWNVCPSVIRGFQYEEWNEMSVRLSYVVSNMRNEMKCCLSVCHTWFPIWGMKWNVCPSVIRGFQYEEWNEMLSVRLSYVVSNMRNEMKCLSVCHTWFPIWGMKWNVCPSVIRGFQYEEWNEMLSVRLCHTWFPIWGMKWNVCPSVIRGFQYEEWNEMSVRLSYVVSNMRNEMKCCLSVCHTWFPIWGMKWNVVCPSVIRGFQYEEWNEMSVRLSYVVSNMRNEMKCLSVSRGHTWFPIWGMKWNVCPSVIRGFQYEEWNEMSVRLSYVVSNMRNEMKCLSVCHTWFPIWGMKWKCLSVCHTWFPIWGMKWNVVCPSVIRGFQYEEWNEMSVRLSYVVSNMRNEMKCLSVCHTWFPIWGMKWNVVCPSVIRGFQYEEWNEMSVRLSYVVSNMRNEMKCLSVCHTWFPIWGMKWNVSVHTWFPI